jgi:hypothetical protein
VWGAGPYEHVHGLNRCRWILDASRTTNTEEDHQIDVERCIPGASPLLTRERSVVDIWREMVRDRVWRMHEESQSSVGTGAARCVVR